MPERLDPKVDVVFKQIFGSAKNKPVLISFLNAVLGWTGDHQIVAVEILNPYLEMEYIDDSYGILDIKVQLGSGELVDVEMQIGDRANMERRSIFYICRVFGDQKITRGRYQDLKRAIGINILDFVAHQGQRAVSYQVQAAGTGRENRADRRHRNPLHRAAQTEKGNGESRQPAGSVGDVSERMG